MPQTRLSLSDLYLYAYYDYFDLIAKYVLSCDGSIERHQVPLLGSGNRSASSLQGDLIQFLLCRALAGFPIFLTLLVLLRCCLSCGSILSFFLLGLIM